ncbi:MAG: hypothetical protein RL885_18270 [Planctomycetota bacterium]
MARRPLGPLLGLGIGWLCGCHGVGYDLDSLEYVRDPRGGYEQEIERDVPVLGWLNFMPLIEVRYGADVEDPAELLVEALGCLGEAEFADDDLRRFQVIALAAECFQKDAHTLVKTTALAAIGHQLEGRPPAVFLGDLPFATEAGAKERFLRFRNVYEQVRSGDLSSDDEVVAGAILAFGRVGYSQLVDLYPILRLLVEAGDVLSGKARQAIDEVLPNLAYQAAWVGVRQGLSRIEPEIRHAAVDLSFALADPDVVLLLLRALEVEQRNAQRDEGVSMRLQYRLDQLDEEWFVRELDLTGEGLQRSALELIVRGMQSSNEMVATSAMRALSRRYEGRILLDPEYWTSWYRQRVAAEAEQNGG